MQVSTHYVNISNWKLGKWRAVLNKLGEAVTRRNTEYSRRNTEMLYEDLTKEIIGAAIEVHKLIGPGMLESAYEECLCYELKLRGLNYERQKPVPIVYKKIKLECGYRIDILVENKIILELKAAEGFNPVHEAQILTYMRFAEKRLGLLINFNVTKLTNSLKRYIL